MNNLSVLIGSCDAYSPLWENFDVLFQRYWNLDTKNILVSETLAFDNKQYKTITPGYKSWGERMLAGLDTIETDYTFFILDDYYLTEPFSATLVQEHMDLLNQYNAVKIMMDIDYGEPTYYLEHIEDDLYKFKNHSSYLNSVQPSIWKTSYLKQVLKPEYNPWQFEIEGNAYTQSIEPLILLKKRDSHMYFNFVRIGGRISEGWEQLYQKENLN
jgi:hypothetical protein